MRTNTRNEERKILTNGTNELSRILRPCKACENPTTDTYFSNAQSNGFKMHKECFCNFCNGVGNFTATYNAGHICKDLSTFTATYIFKACDDSEEMKKFYATMYYDYGYVVEKNNAQTRKVVVTMNSAQAVAKMLGNMKAFGGECKVTFETNGMKKSFRLDDLDAVMESLKYMRKLHTMVKGNKPYNNAIEFIERNAI